MDPLRRVPGSAVKTEAAKVMQSVAVKCQDDG